MTCGAHRAGDGSYLLYDKLNRVPCKRACDKCRAAVDPDNKHEKEFEWRDAVDRARADYLSRYPWAMA